jgi:hypothetical protein
VLIDEGTPIGICGKTYWPRHCLDKHNGGWLHSNIAGPFPNKRCHLSMSPGRATVLSAKFRASMQPLVTSISSASSSSTAARTNGTP